MSTALLSVLACSPENNFQVLDFPYVEGEVLVGLEDTRRADRVLDRTGYEIIEEEPMLGLVRLDIGSDEVPAAIARLERERILDYAEPNYIVEASAIPNDTWFADQWGLDEVNASDAWDLGGQGAGVTVAVLDSGTSAKGKDGIQNLVAGYDAVYNGDENSDVVGHGTHVSGTIAQTTNNAYGVAGLSPDVDLMPVKVLGDGGWGSNYDIAEGIRWAADNGADVVNMSLGGGGWSNSIHSAVVHADDAGVTVLAASGNSGRRGTLDYPAQYDEVISVGATDAWQRVTSYSNEGPSLDITAPGEGILQETPWGWGTWGGTSMACPHAAATAALIIAQGITDPAEVREILQVTAEDLGSAGFDQAYGHGVIDAYAAVAEAQSRSGTGAEPGEEPEEPEEPEEEEPEEPEEPEEESGDTTPPVISGISVDVASGWFEIHWHTDEPATSEILFEDYGSYPDESLTDHHVRDFNAGCNAYYEFRVKSVDADGNGSIGPLWWVQTGGC